MTFNVIEEFDFRFGDISSQICPVSHTRHVTTHRFTIFSTLSGNIPPKAFKYCFAWALGKMGNVSHSSIAVSYSVLCWSLLIEHVLFGMGRRASI